jgi:hypothetical protein
MSRKNHFAGKGFSAKHTTVIDAAVEVVEFASKLPGFSKAVPGFIVPGLKGGVQRRVKVKGMIGGVLLIVRGSTSIQEVRVYSNDPEAVRRSIEREFSE